MEHLLIYPLLSTRDCSLTFFALHLFHDFLFLAEFSVVGSGISSSDSDSPDCSCSDSSPAVVIAVIGPDVFLLLDDDSP